MPTFHGIYALCIIQLSKLSVQLSISLLIQRKPGNGRESLTKNLVPPVQDGTPGGESPEGGSEETSQFLISQVQVQLGSESFGLLTLRTLECRWTVDKRMEMSHSRCQFNVRRDILTMKVAPKGPEVTSSVPPVGFKQSQAILVRDLG